jgi:hypothetical protein
MAKTFSDFESLLAEYAKHCLLGRSMVSMVEVALIRLLANGQAERHSNHTVVALAGVEGVLASWDANRELLLPESSEASAARRETLKEEIFLRSIEWLRINHVSWWSFYAAGGVDKWKQQLREAMEKLFAEHSSAADLAIVERTS